MKTRSLESRGSLSSYRFPLRSAISRIFLALFFSLLRTKGLPKEGSRRWTLEYVIYVSLLMVLEAARTLTERFGHARQKVLGMFAGRKRPGRTYQGYVKARRRITGHQLRMLKRALCRYHRRIAGGYWRRDGWLAFSADGTRIELPRTAANEKSLRLCRPEEDGAAVVVDESVPPGHGSAVGVADRSGDAVGAGAPAADAGMLPRVRCWWRTRALPASICCGRWSRSGGAGSGADGFEPHAADGLADVHVQDQGRAGVAVADEKQSPCPPLQLRLIRIEQANHSPVYLVTSVMDERALTDRQIGQFYRMRWGHEVFYRSFKRTLEQHKMRSGSPQEARRELDWAMLAYLIVGLWSVEALIGAKRDPLCWSVCDIAACCSRRHASEGTVGAGGSRVNQLHNAVKDGYVRSGPKPARILAAQEERSARRAYQESAPPPQKEKRRATRTYEKTKPA